MKKIVKLTESDLARIVKRVIKENEDQWVEDSQEMEKTPTAEDFLQDHLEISHFYDDKTENMVCYSDDVQKAMIEFAKLHVEAALKSASELEETDGTEGYKIYPDSILTAYPLENIM